MLQEVESNAPSEGLLTTREAAQLLNVSEVSVRRWTDQGRLPCIRMGARGVRRFRRADLLDFAGSAGPEMQAAGVAKEADPTAPERPEPESPEEGWGEITLEGMRVGFGSHLCSVYESERGRLKLGGYFLEQGLRQGDLCLLVAPPDAQEALIGRLRSRVEVDRARTEGKLLESNGFSSVEKAYRFFEDRFSEAVADGWSAIRVLGDMAWMVDAGLDEADMTAFEMRYEHFLAKQFPVVSLCQYDARRFSGVELLHALKCHTDTFDQPLERFLAG